MSTPNPAPSREAVAAAEALTVLLVDWFGGKFAPAGIRQMAAVIERATNVGRLRELLTKVAAWNNTPSPTPLSAHLVGQIRAALASDAARAAEGGGK